MDLISWWHPKTCSTCGQCSVCGKSLQGGGYKWNGKKFCSETCTRAGGYRDNPAANENGRYQYVTDCTGSTYEDIQALKESETGVSLGTFRKAVGTAAWKDITASLGYGRDFPISRDWHVGYYKGVYRGVPAYFLRHSMIEHIFTLNGEQGPSLADRDNPYRPTMPRYAVYAGTKVLRRFHDERHAVLFAEKNHAKVWDDARGTAVPLG